ncbi:IclR family transcriptional regulator [Nocardia higoensis]|uniref:IclR family transcriptional regulator n=1 Tax=Nocardia higoensis TaxID=228599 RepID=UPI0002D5906C|nr:IclR family transcriptional regulator [Nocardia higoensis]
MTALMEEQGPPEPAEIDGAGNDRRGTASVVKALQLLDEFLGGDASMGVSDIARRAGIPTSTAFRLLAYLVESGFVSKEGTRYRPGDKLFELGNRVAHSRPRGLREQVAPYLGDLYAGSGLTTRLAILDGADIVILDKVVGLHTLPAPTPIGGRAPATCTALGKALLAFQPGAEIAKVLQGPLVRRSRHSVTNPAVLHRQLVDIRATRLAYDRQESVLGQVCVATPIMRGGVAVGAISLSAPAVRVNLQRSEAALRRTAGQIERVLGG